jgi:hypothetical protein
MLPGFVMTTMIVMMRRFAMMVSGAVVMCRRLVMMFGRRMFSFCHDKAPRFVISSLRGQIKGNLRHLHDQTRSRRNKHNFNATP